MSKNKRKKNSRQDEKQANRVIKIIFVSLIVLGLILMIGVSSFL